MPSSHDSQVGLRVGLRPDVRAGSPGFKIFGVPDNMLAMAHQGIAVVILVLLGIGGMLAA